MAKCSTTIALTSRCIRATTPLKMIPQERSNRLANCGSSASLVPGHCEKTKVLVKQVFSLHKENSAALKARPVSTAEESHPQRQLEAYVRGLRQTLEMVWPVVSVHGDDRLRQRLRETIVSHPEPAATVQQDKGQAQLLVGLRKEIGELARKLAERDAETANVKEQLRSERQRADVLQKYISRGCAEETGEQKGRVDRVPRTVPTFVRALGLDTKYSAAI